MKFYAYKPTSSGGEPMGTEHKLLFELKTIAGAHRRARRYLGKSYRLYTYTNFYADRTFKRV